jgi:hypothetical protein
MKNTRQIFSVQFVPVASVGDLIYICVLFGGDFLLL